MKIQGVALQSEGFSKQNEFSHWLFNILVGIYYNCTIIRYGICMHKYTCIHNSIVCDKRDALLA